MRTNAPLTIEQNAVTLKYGDGLQVTEDGELVSSPNAMQAAPPLYNDGGSFTLLYKDPLVLDSGALSLRTLYSAVDPIVINDGVISLASGAGLSVQNGKLTVVPLAPLTLMGDGSYVGLAVGTGLNTTGDKLNISSPVVPLALSPSGSLQLNYNPANFQLDTSNRLSLRLPDISVSPPLTIANQQIGLEVGKGLTVATNSLQLNVNSNDFYFNSASPTQLSLQPRLISYRSGDVTLTTYDVTADCPNDLTASIAASVQMVWLNGLVQGTIQVKGVSNNWPKGTGTYYGNSVSAGIRFSLIVAPMGGTDNISGFPAATIIPAGSNLSYFQPAGFPSFNYKDHEYYLPIQMGNYVLVPFMPGGSPQLKFMYNGACAMYYSVCQRESASANKILYFTFIILQEADGVNFFSSTQSGLFFTTPPLPFSYTATALVGLQ